MSAIIPSNSPVSDEKMESDHDDPNDSDLSIEYVEASDSEPDSDSGEATICTLWSCTRCLVSIESANLQIHNNDSGCQIFGKITIDGRRGVRYYIYNRSEDEPDTIPAGKGFDLTLSGPKYYVNSDLTYLIYIDLFKKGEQGNEPLISNELFFHHPLHSWDTDNEPIRMVRQEDLASLTVWFTRINPAVTVNLSLTVLNGGGREMVVKGHVKAVQTIPDSRGRERDLILFCSESGVKLHSGESAIPLDRSVVVAPVQLPIDKKEDWGWLTIEVELDISLEDGKKNYRMVGQEKFELHGSDPIWDKYHRTINCMTAHKRELGSLCDYELEDDIKIKMIVAPFCDLFNESLEGDSSVRLINVD